jgi:hypothetical protein
MNVNSTTLEWRSTDHLNRVDETVQVDLRPCPAVVVSVVDVLGAESLSMKERAALMVANEEQTTSLETALLRGHSGLVVRTRTRAAQRGLYSSARDIDDSSSQVLVDPASYDLAHALARPQT